MNKSQRCCFFFYYYFFFFYARAHLMRNLKSEHQNQEKGSNLQPDLTCLGFTGSMSKKKNELPSVV